MNFGKNFYTWILQCHCQYSLSYYEPNTARQHPCHAHAYTSSTPNLLWRSKTSKVTRQNITLITTVTQQFCLWHCPWFPNLWQFISLSNALNICPWCRTQVYRTIGMHTWNIHREKWNAILVNSGGDRRGGVLRFSLVRYVLLKTENSYSFLSM